MAIPAHNITTKRDIVKPLQFVGETDTVTTPASYGITPTSATFALVGNNTEINPQPDIQHADVAVLGTEDLIAAVLTKKLYTFSLRYNPVDLALWRHLWNASGGGTNSPDESLSFTYSYNLDGIENFQHIRGARPTSGTLSVSQGLWECDMTFICKDITIPNTTDGNGGTPVYLSSETSSLPLVHSDGGGSPFTWNSVDFGERRFSTTVTRAAAVMDVNGETDIVYTKMADRNITLSADVFVKNTTFLTDFEAKTAQATSYKVDTSPIITLTYANAVLTAYNQTPSAGATNAFIESIAARAESVTDIT